MNGLAERRIQLLRPIEQLCYQVAHYLLGDAHEAAAASEEALISLYQLRCLTALSDEELQRMAKDTAIRCAMTRAKEIRKQKEQEQSPALRL